MSVLKVDAHSIVELAWPTDRVGLIVCAYFSVDLSAEEAKESEQEGTRLASIVLIC